MATKVLKKAVIAAGLEYEIDEGGGAFYGPKIDLKLYDSLGREWQCSTIQFDFNLPERFKMKYVGADGKYHTPYIVHRALFGSIERFFALQIENYKGDFPLKGIFVVEIVFELHEADDFLLSHVYRPPMYENLHLDDIKHKFYIQWVTE
jgi:threonyl-tRNA synthetase